MEKAKGKKLFYRPAGKRKGMYTPTQIICASFVIVIALGTFLLSLPVASKHGRLDVLDAMFTATSATCVTGLIVRDTWTQFTYFGQAVILLLIQVGGLGLVTLTSFFALAMRRRMGFRDLRLLGESVSADDSAVRCPHPAAGDGQRRCAEHQTGRCRCRPHEVGRGCHFLMI